MTTISHWTLPTGISHRPKNRTKLNIAYARSSRAANPLPNIFRHIILYLAFLSGFSSCTSSDKLFQAASQSNLAELKRLVEVERADINSPNVNGMTPLFVASGLRNVNMVRYLLERGANPDLQTWYGQTALMEAVKVGSIEICTLLIDKAANVRTKDIHGWTTFLLTACYGRVDMMKLLLERGANVNDRIKYWEKGDSLSALTIAALYDREQAVEYLKAHGLTMSNQKAFVLPGFPMANRESPLWPQGHVVLEKISGKDTVANAMLELDPATYTAAVSLSLPTQYSSDYWSTRITERKGTLTQVDIAAKGGHIYVIHAAIAEENWLPLVRDYSIR